MFKRSMSRIKFTRVASVIHLVDHLEMLSGRHEHNIKHCQKIILLTKVVYTHEYCHSRVC